MNSQLYTAASGLLVEQQRVELISNNLANISTAGFRARRAFSSVFDTVVAAEAGNDVARANRAVTLAGSYEIPGPGTKHQTGRPLDIALPDGTFLVIDTPAGRRYTRVGELLVSPRRELTDARGNPLLDEKGARIGNLNETTTVTNNGRVYVRQPGAERIQEQARLMVVRDTQQLLRLEGGGMFSADGADQQLEIVREPKVQPGWIEGSAADPLGELVLLIESQRAFESYQKLVSLTMNEVNRRIINEVAG
jgi:flagellar basal-body rod protein FlgG